MCRSASTGRDSWYSHWWSSANGRGDFVVLRRRIAMFAIAGVVIGSASGFGASANAADSNVAGETFAALRDYAQSVASAPATKPAQPADQDRAKTTNLGDEGSAFGSLRAFVQDLNADRQRSSGRNLTKLADADNAVDALRELFQKQNGSAPAEKPKRPAPVVAKPKAPPVEASYVGTKICLGCHTSQAEAFGHTLMGRLLTQGKMQCESCHGPGSAHAKAGGGRGVGGIISFRKDDTSRTAEENNGICLGCHERGDRTYWSGSPHETRGVACTNCHTVMQAVSRKFQLKTAFEPDTCFQCHKDRRAQMARSSHMPLREGKMVCSDCHNPHGSFTEAMLRKDSINDTCYTCHAEKRGPFLFEHAPVRENCLNCHDPHGSVNEYLLKVSRPRLCAECHTFDHGPNIANGPNIVFAFSRSCQNCHNAVHGTNSPSGALLHR